MTLEDEAYVKAVWDRWDEVARKAQKAGKHPPVILKGPGFVMLCPPLPDKPRQHIPEHLLYGMLGSLIVSVATLIFLYHFGPSLVSQ
jgi:hypothetical protein